MRDPKKVVVPAVIAVLGLTGFIWWSRNRAAAEREAALRIVANGTIDAEEVEVGSQRPARLARYEVAEGQFVKKGAIIAVLDTSELEAQMEQAQGAAASAAGRLAELLRGTRTEEVQAARAGVQQASASLDGARRALATARLNFTRRTQLRLALDDAEAKRDVAREGVRQAEASLRGADETLRIAQEDHESTVQLRTARDAARQQLETAQASARGAKAQLDQLLNGTRSEELQAAEATLGQADAALLAAREEMGNANSDLNRAKELHEGNALSDQALDAAQTRADTAKARMGQAEQAKQQAQARLQQAKTGARSEEIESARASLASAQAAVEGGQRAVENSQKALDLRIAQRTQLETAKTGRQVAEAQLASAKAALGGAESAVKQSRTAYQDAIAEKQGLDSALTQYQAGIAQLDNAEAQLALRRNGATREQIAQARGQLQQAKGALELAKTQHEQSVIRAPIDGVLTDQVAKVGEVVNPGATVATLVPLDEAYLTLYLPLTELGKVKIGQQVTVSTDTYGDQKKYQGKVTEIGNTPEFTPRNVQTPDERVKQVFEVKVTVQNHGRDLKPGMPADAIIHLQ